MAKAIGNIITLVAVLDIHIDMNAVANMKPSTIRCILDPTK